MKRALVRMAENFAGLQAGVEAYVANLWTTEIGPSPWEKRRCCSLACSRHWPTLSTLAKG